MTVSPLLAVGLGTDVTKPNPSVQQHQVQLMGKQSGSSCFVVDEQNRSIHNCAYFGGVFLHLGTAVKDIVFRDVFKLIRFD